MELVETFVYKEEFLDRIKKYKYGLNWLLVLHLSKTCLLTRTTPSLKE